MANDWRDTVRSVLELQADPAMDTAPGPALQWYPAQWLGDAAVQLMGWSARGVHLHLLMLAWKGFDLDSDPVPCSIPDDPELLADLFQLGGDWPLVWRQVGRAWRLHEGRLWNLGLCRAYLAQMSKRRASRESAEKRWHRARIPTAEESHSGSDANASFDDANACGDDANAPTPECSSVFSLPASSSEGNPPYPPKGGKRTGRKIPSVKIPEALAAIGIDREAFSRRVETCSKTKRPEAWQSELNLLARVVPEVGKDIVLALWEESYGTGWQGVTPTMCKERAARAGQGRRQSPTKLDTSGMPKDFRRKQQ